MGIVCDKKTESTVIENIVKRNQNNLNEVAFKSFGSKLTYKDFFELVDTLTKGFIKLGIKNGDIVTVCMAGTVDSMAYFYALSRIGTVNHLVNPNYFKVNSKKYINETRSKLLIVLDRFYLTFKTITFDNGVEFMGYEGIEKSCRKKGIRTQIYYAHLYCSGERGTNENNNRMIRRWIPKGTDITNIKNSFIKEIEDWINNYSRAMFDINVQICYY